MMLDTADNKIYFPRFYDIDTICSYDNSGQLKFDVDIEMEQGYWNTSSSRLWTRIRDLMHNDIVATYNNMRQNGVSYENMMHYIYDEQIAKISQTYYNKDYDIKYAPFADSYIGMAHGDTYEHVKRWLKQRFTFVDTLFDYAPSYNNDVLTIRANTTELMTLEIETYTPVYQHLSWYNGQMDKKKIDGKISVEFSGTAQAATDQEVLIYGGSNVKSIKGITSMNPNRMLIGSATKLVEIDAHDCPLLADINANKANLSPHEYLNKVNLSNCPLLEGNLRLNNSPLVQELDIRGTNITEMNLPSSIRNLQVLRLPNTMTELTLNDANMLHTLEFDEGVNLQSISMTNCNALENVVNFDLLQTPSITLNSSYNNVAELYFRDTTNLSLSNMPNLERVIFTPNNEYETFELINVANAPDYKVTTFNCPKLSTFMTTAPYRESYNNCGMNDKEISIETNDVFIGGDDRWTGEDAIKYISEGTVALTGRYKSSDYIEATPGNIYTLTSEDNASYVGIVFFDSAKNILEGSKGLYDVRMYTVTLTAPSGTSYVRYFTTNGIDFDTVLSIVSYDYIQVKDYGDIQPNTTFTASSIDISNTQFTDVKLLCTTDTNTLKLPVTVKNFYCDSSFDLDTDYLEDGEYDVVHGELVEPYTTDYEGEVVRFSNNETSLLMKDICTIPNSYINEGTGEAVYHYTYSLSDFIEVVSGTRIALNFWVCRVSEFNADKRYIKNTVLYNSGTQKLILDSNCKYIRVYVEPNYLDDINVITCTPLVTYVPNLIPSSADGSLIFSMYAPNNTVTPVSGTWDLHGLKFDNFHTFGMNNDVKQDSEGNITMPARYDDYNITIKNANIKPTTHNTMLYPLLVNEDNPITGTLDYTNYAGKHLSWSFAYTDEEYVNITQPKDELINSYEYRYNAFYDTEFEFVNPYEVARYTSSASGVLPSFNTEFTYTYDETDNGDGTYTTKIYADSFDNLPTSIKFDQQYANDLRLLTVDKLSITSAITNMRHMFRNNRALTYVNTDGWDTSNVTDMNEMFCNCYALTSLDVSNFNADKLTDMGNMFIGCSKLTSLDVSGFNTSNVSYMGSMFQNCNSLTSLDVSGFDTSNVTSMANMFYGCSGLTSLDVSGFDTTKVTNMSSMFQNCNSLTSLDVSGFDTSNVTSMANMFIGCSKLTSLDVSNFDTSNVTNMESMFRGCNSLTEIRGIENWVTSKVQNMSNMFNACSVTSLDLSNWDTSSLTNCNGMFYQSNIVSLDLSNWDTSNCVGSNCYEMIVMCKQMMTLKLEGWTTIDLINQIKLWVDSVTGKVLYGTAIIDETLLLNGWEYYNALEVAIYTCSTSGVLPIFNKEFTTYTHAEVDNGDGTYTTKVATDSLDNLPTKISFNGISDNTYITTLLRVDKLNTSQMTNMESMFRDCRAMTYVNVRSFDTSKVAKMDTMFRSCIKLETIDGIEDLNTSQVTGMSGMFQGCKIITSLDLHKWDVSKVRNADTMFGDFTSLTSLNIEGWEFHSFNSDYGLAQMFQGCAALSEIKGIENLLPSDGMFKRFDDMFNGCSSLTTLDLSSWNTSNVTNMSMMFKNCNKLTTLDVSNFDTSKVTNMGEMFSGCNVLSIEGLGNWDVKNVTDMGNMFLHCKGITSLLEISDWDTSSLKNMYRMFMGCNELIELDISNWNTSRLESLYETFYDCKKIISFNLGNWDCRRVTSMYGTFFGCTSLSSITLPKEVSKGCNSFSAFRNCTNLKEVTLPRGIGDIAHIFNNCSNLEKAVIPLDNINNTQDSTFNNCRALIDVDWVGDLSNNFNIITNTGEHITTESDIHELMTNLGDLKKDKIKISLSKGTIKVNDTEKTIE